MDDGRRADRKRLSELCDLIDELDMEGRFEEAEEAWMEAHAIVMALTIKEDECQSTE